ncbi:MAG: DnaJ domain-containing protein [Acidobacteriia bacterium]|nr:DnaJ domain-containing protein [Terriglobia bacterium]
MAIQRPQAQSSKRRSTRVAAGVSMNVRGLDANGQAFVERRVTLEVSFQGCKYYSRYELPKDTWLTVEIPNQKKDLNLQPYRARVAWLRRSPQLRGLFQVGVEFEAPGNFWGLANPPEDWRHADAPRASAETAFEQEMKEMLALAGTGTYYQLLRITADSPRAQARQNYYKLVRKFHPDRHMDHAEWLPSLHKLMEAVTVAYKTLTDEAARRKYDQQLAASSAFTLGQRPSEVQKTAEECLEKARECFRAQNSGGTILWLRKTVEMEPNSSKYHALLARALSAVPPLRREAVEHFEKAVEIDPWNTAARLQLSALYEGLKLPWRARSHYQKVLEIDTTNAKAQERLRALDAESGEKKRAIMDRIFHHSSK